MAGSVAFLFITLIATSSARITSSLLIELSLVSAILIPFFLPKMHARYFYPSDVISIILAFYFPTYFFVPIVLITTSFFAYSPALFGLNFSRLPLLSLGILTMLTLIAGQAIKHLYANTSKEINSVHQESCAEDQESC